MSIRPLAGLLPPRSAFMPGQRFLATGEGAVWVLEPIGRERLTDGPHTSQVTATIPVNVPGDGGCIAAGEGGVWRDNAQTPLSRIDPGRNAVTEQFTGVGGDCISTGFDSIWLSNHELGNVCEAQPSLSERRRTLASQ